MTAKSTHITGPLFFIEHNDQQWFEIRYKDRLSVIPVAKTGKEPNHHPDSCDCPECQRLLCPVKSPIKSSHSNHPDIPF